MRWLLLVYKKISIPFVLVFLVILFVWLVDTQSKNGREGNSSALLQPTKRICVPTPIRPTAINFQGQIAPTPPPVASTEFSYSTSRPPTIDTRYVISKTNDLATNSPDQNKTYIYIMHCNGTIELFKVLSSGDINKDLQLLPDDFVLDWIPPASLMGSHPPSITNTKIPGTQIPLTTGYPPPAMPIVTPTRIAYP